MLSTPEFAEFAGDHVMFLHVTSRVEGDAYQDLLSEKGGSGFPYLAILDAKGNVLERCEDGRDVDGFETSIGKAREFVALGERAAAGDQAAAVSYFTRALALGHYTLEEATKKSLALKDLTDEQRTEIAEGLVELEFRAILGSVKGDDDVAKAGEQCLAMAKDDREPTGDESRYYFHILMGRFGESAGNRDALERAAAGLDEMAKSNPGIGRAAKHFRDVLEKLGDKKDGADKDG